VATPLEIHALEESGALDERHRGLQHDVRDRRRRLFCWGAGDTGLLGNGGLVDAGVPTR
jgi:hypothetical protein